MTVLKRTSHHIIIIAGIWLLYKAVTYSSSWALLLPVLAIFFIVEQYSQAAGFLSFLIFLFFEIAISVLGLQELDNSLICSGVILMVSAGLVILRRLITPESKSDDYSTPESSSVDSFSVPTWPPSFSLLSYAEATDLDTKRLRNNIEVSCRYFLELTRQAMGSETAVLLQGEREKGLSVYSFSSNREEDLLLNPESGGYGIFNPLLHDREEMIVYPVSQQGDNIPYYPSNRGVGSLMAVRIYSEMLESGKQFILSLDRRPTEAWTAWQKDYIRKAAQKLGLELDIGLHISRAAHNTNTISRICTHLQQMNKVIDLDSTYQIAIRSVRDLVDCDFAALSLINGGEHVIVQAEGLKAEKFSGKKFPVTEGLVGQAIKRNHWMPPNATYHGPAPIFSKENPISGYKSLFIQPLGQEGGDILGVLTLCSQKRGVYRKEEREVLELICRHVTTKIELAQAHERIYKLALTDGLTGLKNHRTFQRGFNKMLQRAKRQSTPICLILGDLDHFKSINDNYGHPFGDEVLKAVAQTLQKSVREVDLVARYGGEEFAIILENSDENGGIVQAERVRKAINSLSFRVQGDVVSVSMSLGLAVFPDDGALKDIIIDKADQALYYAKKRGRDMVVPYSAFRKN